ncbi:TBC domain-containing protein kinase-like protein [Toxocara canis]|uniref:TBC domain-containing protein kinase-like protein n=1 Tax=Toxocara canis TaxID=6265 RepID=A0A0B2W2V6_TOXCA|nr:TBC domain-containing protein kinase-like protein [Toxocara canis]
MLTHSLNSILSPNSERLQTMGRDTVYTLQSLNDTVAALQNASRSTQQAENDSSFASDAEEQQRRRSAVFSGVAESRELPYLRHDRDVESAAVILDERNADGVPVVVYRMGVFNPTKRRPIKMRCFGDAEFGAVTLIGRESRNRTSLNGLPATPSSTRMLGRFALLATLSHPNLCTYIEIIRSNTLENAVLLISEHYRWSVRDEICKGVRLEVPKVVDISAKVVSSIAYLHQHDIVLGYFSLGSILLLPQEEVRLAQYGLYYLSGGGLDVDCCVGCAWYLAPERLVRTSVGYAIATRAGDIWAFGIALFEMNVGVLLSDVWGLKQIFAVIRESVRRAVRGSAFYPLLDAIRLARPNTVIEVDVRMEALLARVLSVRPSDRPTARQLLLEMNQLAENTICVEDIDDENEENGFCQENSLNESIAELQERISKEETERLKYRPINEAFFLWKLCGSSVENILLNHGIIRANSSINTLPVIVLGDCFMYGNSSSRRYASIFDVFLLPSNNLRQRMKSVDKGRFIINFELSEKRHENSDLSLIVKERDIEYQMHRMFVLARLVDAFPYKRRALLDECGSDVPPLYRASLWASFLNIAPSAIACFKQFDTLDEHPSDRQLMVDIPRCHQYDELMASPAAHYKLKRLLKAWLLSHKNYVYWQGLDSLAAPFLVLHFNRIPVAYACLESFISLYLHNFFLKDNSAIIQEYLAVFSHLLAYVDASLYWHLHEMDFLPELFAIPWFLTCFAHVLPLHKLFHLWDVLLLCDSSFPLFVGVAIMEQMRARLITAHFNDAILLFSDLPGIFSGFL